MSENEIQRRLSAAVEKVQLSLSRSHFRPMMKEVHSCSMKCYDNNNASDEQVANCEQNCASMVQAYKQVFENEMNSFQSRLQRGVMDCQDAAQDKVTESLRNNPQKMDALQTEMQQCIGVVVDKHISLLPGLQKKIESQINSIAKK